MDQICALLYRGLWLWCTAGCKTVVPCRYVHVSVLCARVLCTVRKEVSHRIEALSTTLARVTLPRRAASMKCSFESAKLCGVETFQCTEEQRSLKSSATFAGRRRHYLPATDKTLQELHKLPTSSYKLVICLALNILFKAYHSRVWIKNNGLAKKLVDSVFVNGMSCLVKKILPNKWR